MSTFARGLGLLALSGLAAFGNVGMRRPPISLIQLAWPTLQPVTSEASHAPMWSIPDGGRKTLFFATLIDLRL